jgi:hypothetical protein
MFFLSFDEVVIIIHDEEETNEKLFFVFTFDLRENSTKKVRLALVVHFYAQYCAKKISRYSASFKSSVFNGQGVLVKK